MAIRPPVTPKWATSCYGNDDLAWEEAKRQCRDALRELCARREPHAYSDLIARVTAIPWPPGNHSSGQLGYLLGQVSLEELDPTEDRPVISSVVASGKYKPSHGYWAFVEEDLGIRVPAAGREAFWLEEMDRCFEVYGRGVRPA
jgi:hypothetical protein